LIWSLLLELVVIDLYNGLKGATSRFISN
jgi:hypothetical protein